MYSVGGRQIDTERQRASICCFTPQMPLTARGPSKTQPSLPSGWQEPNDLSRHLLPPKVLISREIKSGAGTGTLTQALQCASQES